MLAIYTRLSKDDDDSNSIENQKREALQYIQDNNIVNSKFYDEGKGFSGTLRIKERPKLKTLIEDIEKGLVSSVWMRRQDRIARSGLVFAIFAEAIKKHNVQLYFGDKGHVDLHDPIQWFHLSIMAAVDELKPNAQSKSTKKALKDNAKEGKAWGVIPFGYKTDDNMMIMVDENEAETVKRIFKESLKGSGVTKIANGLNDDRVPTKYHKYGKSLTHINKHTGKATTKLGTEVLWSPKTVEGVLRCKWYIGERTYSGETYPTPKIDVPFNEIQNGIVKRTHQKKQSYRYLLKGLVRCGKCGRNYYGIKKFNKKRTYLTDNYYACSSKRVPRLNCGNNAISIPKLESFIIKHLFYSKDLLNVLKRIDSDDDTLKTQQSELTNLKDQLKSQEKMAIRLAELLANTLQDDELLIKKYKSTTTNIKSLKSKIDISEARITDRKTSKYLNQYIEVFDNFNFQNNFLKVENAVKSIVEDIELLGGTDINNQQYYIIQIKYRGFDERSIFTTIPPYNKWIWSNRTYSTPTPQDVENEIGVIEFLYGKKIENEDYPKYLSDFYTESVLPETILTPKDVINYN